MTGGYFLFYCKVWSKNSAFDFSPLLQTGCILLLLFLNKVPSIVQVFLWLVFFSVNASPNVEGPLAVIL